ncbi:Transcriptional regulator, AraC family [Rubellimicrobium mesophilum DSM 19309]|uniref:Transcriptional regulator, AraC family n=1 Tax=Rubellimicrobium mesophilum DSM 19309 TaxID=442562 RepID=A0A017HS03_9RHOB|nr:GlxA family transcriptional regulator [Rubellimicrobium mesophilum]EYD77287.1 Transcriptional regulator, AraC family [Rubellimicrobium mesophilum DSM 19309]
MTESRTFVFLLVEDFTHLAFSCAIEPLRIANFVAGRELYRWSLAAEGGRDARSSNGLLTRVDRGLDPLDRDERLFVVSGLNVERRVTPEILAYLRRERVRGRGIGAICSGAYVLAEAGFLAGVEAAIHWAYHDLMAERFPEVILRPNVFVAGPRFDTASGGTAAADLMLHLIGRDHGEDLATEVADQMVYNAVREGSARQRVSVQARFGTRNATLVQAIRMFEENLEAPPRPSEVAAGLGISARQLERLFDRHLGTSPKRYAMELRLNRARNLIVQTEQSVAEIAMASGFTSTSHFSRVFRAKYGISPGAQRARLT